ncbi:hypothetical protein [Lysinibacillus xylanilyticus]|uniref:hypothetical protein n=1 Tax=Lysinibacillus xylanilyticus TaxID=582475 RepID=UPI0038072EFE
MNNKLNESIGNWEKTGTEVKYKIYQKTIHKQQKKPKNPFIKPFLAVAALFIFAISTILLTMNLSNKEAPQQLADSESFTMYDERTIEITKYEMFFRDMPFYSKEAVEFFSLSETIRKYALFHYLEKRDYRLDEENRNVYRERIKTELEYDMKDANLKAYYDKMFADLQITVEEYIEYYLLINREYDKLYQDLFNKRIGLDETGAYPSGDAEKEYRSLVGITEQYMDELAEKIPERLEPMEPQPNLPYNTTDFNLKVTTNEQGEYIFVESMYFLTNIAQTYYDDLLLEINREIVKEELTRHSFKRYQEAIRTYLSDDAEKIKLAKELETIFEILGRTIEMEYDMATG